MGDGLDAAGAGSPGGTGGAGSATGSRPSPDGVGLAASLTAVVGLGWLWLRTRLRRRSLAPAPITTRRETAPAAEGWTNVRLDDNEALPQGLRAIAEPEQAAAEPAAPMLAPELPGQNELAPEHPVRPAEAFTGSLEPGAMRLAIAADQTELFDQPGELGVVLATLIAGDEVEIQDIQEPWVRVVTPLGSTGWLRTASLGVGGAPPEDQASGAPPEQHEPKRRGAKTPRRSRAARPAT